MKRIFLILLSVIVILFSSITIFAAPGDNNDPLITLSYLESRLTELIQYIDQNLLSLNEASQEQAEQIDKLNTTLEEQNVTIDENTQAINQLNLTLDEQNVLIEEQKQLIENLNTELENIKHQPGGSILEIVELTAGQTLICEAGAEVILRAGEGTAIISEAGGLSDVTGGIDLKQGEIIPKNHLLIIPRSDGRGVYVDNYAIFMIRGAYTIE